MVNTPERLLAFSLCVCCLAWIARRLPGRSASPQLSDGELAALRSKLLNAVIDNCTAPELEMLLLRAPRSQRAHLANSVYDDHGKSQKTALFLATANRSPSLASTLLLHGANISAGRLDEGTTPMHLAAGWLHSGKVVEVLLAAADRAGVVSSIRAKPFAGGLRRQTPVYWASHYGQSRTMLRLIAWMRDEGGGWRYDAASDTFEPPGGDDGGGGGGGGGLGGHEPSDSDHSARLPKLVEEQGQLEEQLHVEEGEEETWPLKGTHRQSLSAEEAIAAIDKSGTGEVSLAELGTLLRLAGADPTEAEVVEYRSILRTRGFTAVTPKALGKILTVHEYRHPPAEQQKQLEEAFSIIDEDGDGVVRDGEMSRLLELLTTVGEPLTEEESEQFLAEVDEDGDGAVTRSEFMHFTAR